MVDYQGIEVASPLKGTGRGRSGLYLNDARIGYNSAIVDEGEPTASAILIITYEFV